jgi:hypothetical protein
VRRRAGPFRRAPRSLQAIAKAPAITALPGIARLLIGTSNSSGWNSVFLGSVGDQRIAATSALEGAQLRRNCR